MWLAFMRIFMPYSSSFFWLSLHSFCLILRKWKVLSHFFLYEWSFPMSKYIRNWIVRLQRRWLKRKLASYNRQRISTWWRVILFKRKTMKICLIQVVVRLLFSLFLDFLIFFIFTSCCFYCCCTAYNRWD